MKPYLLLIILICFSIVEVSQASYVEDFIDEEDPISPTSRAAIEQFLRRQPKEKRRDYYTVEEHLKQVHINRSKRKARKKSQREN